MNIETDKCFLFHAAYDYTLSLYRT